MIGIIFESYILSDNEFVIITVLMTFMPSQFSVVFFPVFRPSLFPIKAVLSTSRLLRERECLSSDINHSVTFH